MIINDLDGYYIVFDTKNWNTELDTLIYLFTSSHYGNSLLFSFYYLCTMYYRYNNLHTYKRTNNRYIYCINNIKFLGEYEHQHIH